MIAKTRTANAGRGSSVSQRKDQPSVLSAEMRKAATSSTGTREAGRSRKFSPPVESRAAGQRAADKRAALLRSRI